MEQNFDVFDFALGDDEMVAIAALDTGRSAFFDQPRPRHHRMDVRARAQRVDERQTALITY